MQTYNTIKKVSLIMCKSVLASPNLAICSKELFNFLSCFTLNFK